MIFFEKLSKASSDATINPKDHSEQSRLNTDDLMGALSKSGDGLGSSYEYKRLEKIYNEFGNKGRVDGDKTAGTKQILM